MWRAEGKRALYNSSGRSAVYAAQRRGGASAYSGAGGGYTPRARSGWSNFRYQQRTYNRHGADETLSVDICVLRAVDSFYEAVDC